MLCMMYINWTIWWLDKVVDLPQCRPLFASSPLHIPVGYEDEAEFEDALNGPFSEFLRAMPHIETMIDDKGRLLFKVRPDPPREAWQPTKMTLKILDREDVSCVGS